MGHTYLNIFYVVIIIVCFWVNPRIYFNLASQMLSRVDISSSHIKYRILEAFVMKEGYEKLSDIEVFYFDEKKVFLLTSQGLIGIKSSFRNFETLLNVVQSSDVQPLISEQDMILIRQKYLSGTPYEVINFVQSLTGKDRKSVGVFLSEVSLKFPRRKVTSVLDLIISLISFIALCMLIFNVMSSNGYSFFH